MKFLVFAVYVISHFVREKLFFCVVDCSISQKFAKCTQLHLTNWSSKNRDGNRSNNSFHEVDGILNSTAQFWSKNVPLLFAPQKFGQIKNRLIRQLI